MFDTGEWNDDVEAQTLTESVVSTQKEKAADSQAKKGALSRKKRLKRNRELLEILQTLKSTNAQNSDLPPPPEDVCPPGKKKKGTPNLSLQNPPTASTEAPPPPPDAGKHLNRQQWKNKMKNKRKNRNKFKVSEEKDAAGIRDGESRAGEEERGGGRGSSSKKDGLVAGSRSHRAGQPGDKTRSVAGEEIDPPGGTSKDNDEGQKKVRPKEKTPLGGTCDPASPRLTAAEKARLKKLKKLLNKEAAQCKKDLTTDENSEDTTAAAADSNPAEEEVADRSASLRSRMEQRLHSARFRYINEQLYTSDSQEAAQLFQNDPEAFTLYHTGFSQQVQRWPVSPINEIIKYVKNRPASLVVADFGCGDAQLARSVRNQVHSFDLVALNNRVTACDMAQVPLSDGTVDIAVFCLSLMGKNLSDFLREANRVLQLEGMLLIAEVSSRFDDVRQFMTAMSQLGFKCVNKNTENSHFYLFEFNKVRPARDASKHPGLKLKPCLYKKR